MFALAKPSSNVPFMMPKRIAESPNPASRSRNSSALARSCSSATSGSPATRSSSPSSTSTSRAPSRRRASPAAKVVKVDRVEWLAIADAQQAINALSAGEIDYMEQPPHDLLPLVKGDSNLKIVVNSGVGQFTFRPNSLVPPFNNPKIKQALWYALNQEDFLKATVGDPAYYKVCKSFYPCGTPLATTAGMDGLLTGNSKKAQELLKEAGYDGTPIVLMASTDLPILTNLGPVAKQLLERAGFKVDMQSMDWQTLVARRNKKDTAQRRRLERLRHGMGRRRHSQPRAHGLHERGFCDKALFGWPCDEKIEKLRTAFMKAPDAAAQKKIAEEAQLAAIAYTTHIPLGEYSRRWPCARISTGSSTRPFRCSGTSPRK